MSETKVCPHCAEEVQAEAKVCKHCGRRFSSYNARGKWVVPTWAVVVILVLVVVVTWVLIQGSVERSRQNGKDKADDFMCQEIDTSYC